MSKITSGSTIHINQLRAAVKNATASKRIRTEEAIYLARRNAVEREVVGQSIRLAPGRRGKTAPPHFAAPAKRKKEYRSSSGLRSFHFAWSSISKSSAPRTKPGTRVYANAAANHIAYIEDGANLGTSHITYIEDGAIVRTDDTVYIDSSRVECRPDGEPLVLSNISEHYHERVEFFALVEKSERENHGDTVDLDFQVNAIRWAKVASEPDCDPSVMEAFERFSAGGPSRQQRIALRRSGSDLRRVMARHGFTFTNPLDNEAQLKRDGFFFHDGRGGRTEYRLVFELPREINREQRADALERLCHRFEEAGCMYVAVIHAPDPHNDQDNYHIHLDFYDRQCRRLDGSKDDLRNVKSQFEAVIAEEMQAGRFRAAVHERAWDFMVERTYESNKKKKTHRPFGATKKSKAVRQRDFVQKVREGFAEDVNLVARQAGLGELYDPRSYATMGIKGPVSVKLGSKKHGLETKGVPTTTGLDNESAQALFEIGLIEQAYKDRCRHIDEIQLRWEASSNAAPAVLSSAKAAIDAELAMARMAAEVRRELDFLALEQERERSRARLVSDRQRRASRTGSAAARTRSAALAQSADEHLAALNLQDADLVPTIAELESFEASHNPEQAARLIMEFEREKSRSQAEALLAPAFDGPAAAGRRNIMIKRGTLGSAEVSFSGGKSDTTTIPLQVVLNDATEESAAALVTIRSQDGVMPVRVIAPARADAGAHPAPEQAPASLLVENTAQPPSAEATEPGMAQGSPRPRHHAEQRAQHINPDDAQREAVAIEAVASGSDINGRMAAKPGLNGNDKRESTRDVSTMFRGNSRTDPRHGGDPTPPSQPIPDEASKRNGMDLITAAKMLWALEEIVSDPSRKASQADGKLHAQALQHPRATELLAALARGRDRHRSAAPSIGTDGGQQERGGHASAATNCRPPSDGFTVVEVAATGVTHVAETRVKDHASPPEPVNAEVTPAGTSEQANIAGAAHSDATGQSLANEKAKHNRQGALAHFAKQHGGIGG